MPKQNAHQNRSSLINQPQNSRLGELVHENEELRARLAEAEETLNAIQSGQVDAVVVSGPKGEQVFTLKSADYAYRALVEAMNEGAATISTGGLVIYCNKKFASLLGMREEKVIGHFVQSLIPAAHVAPFEALLARAIKGEACEAEFRFESINGKPEVAYVSLSSVEADGAAAVCMVITDLTQHQSEVRLRLAQKAARCGTWQWNPITDEAVWSDELWEIFGLAQDSCRPSYKNWLRAIHPEDRDAVHDIFQRQLATGHFDFEFRTLWSDGTVHWAMSLGMISSPDCVIGINMDITERKQTEQALIRSEKLATVGRMAATVAHEINNPLAAVMNTLYLVQTCPELPEEARQYLETAEVELKRIAHITRQTLGFYRESSAPATFSVSTLLDSVLDLLQGKIKAKRVTIDRRCEEHLQMTGVFGELRQVFSNLLTNSLDAVDINGTVKLRASTAPFTGKGHRVRVTVMDNGQGIDTEALPHLFEPFFTTKGQIGNGLGLWISKEIIDKHHGSIRVHSRTTGAYKGTTVSVVIPAEAA